MCGIAGVVRRGGAYAAWLRAMARVLAHRGPDGEGIVRFEPYEVRGVRWQAGLAHRRLAIFDPTPAGAQPMRSRSGRTTMVLNGEIYNHPELRRRLPGFAWRSATDTEVLLELFEREGPSVLAHVNGMFAFAVWDERDKRVWLGRDRLGIKPLFYRADAEGLVFASELRGILAGPSFARRLDPAAASAYLDFGFIPAPMSALEGVAKLPPGCLLEWRDGRVRIDRWWELPEPETVSDPAWRELLFTRLLESVRLRLRGDVPVGCFLSGGLDSTLLAALAMRERGDLETFSVSFPEDPGLDEGAHARHAAGALGTRHFELRVTSAEISHLMPRLLHGIDEPFADSSLVPMQLLSRAASSRVKVALSGDGADELFAGYRRYGADRWLHYWRLLPASMRGKVLAPLLRRIPDDRSTRYGEIVRRVRKVVEADFASESDRAYAMARIFSEAQKLRVAPGLAPHLEVGRSLLRSMDQRLRGRDGLDTRLRVDLRLGLPDDMLTKVDRASMSTGLEVRVPFLDHRFVEHAASLPSDLKRRGVRSKVALRDVFGAALPTQVRRRRKAGFDAPLTAWLRGPLRDLLHDGLAAERLQGWGLLDAREVRRLVGEHDDGRADHSWRLWSLLVLADWSDRNAVTRCGSHTSPTPTISARSCSRASCALCEASDMTSRWSVERGRCSMT